MKQETSLALEHLICAVGDPIREIRDIGPEHPEFVRAQTIRAGAGVMAKVPETLPAIARFVETAKAHSPSPRARTHLAAAEAWLSGNPLLAAESYAFILDRWPRDLLALRLAQSCYFFLGQHDRLCDVVETVAPKWEPDEWGFRFVLGMSAFAYAENGDGERAEALGRQSLARSPSCPMAVHAIAHALAESGQHREGAQWMRAQHAHWARESRMRTHNAWHLAMFEVENGNVEPALEIFDQWLLPASAQSPLEACDAAGLLWRLALEGVDAEGRWRELSDMFEGVTPGFWPFVDLHAALAHLSAGKRSRAQRLAQQIERCTQGGDYAALRARLVTQPGLKALDAWSQGRYSEAAELFGGMRSFLGDAGGSRIQIAVFESIEQSCSLIQRGSAPILPAPSG